MSQRRPLASPDEVSEYLGVPKGTLTMWRYRKERLAWIKVGRHVRYRWEEIERYLDDQSSKPNPAA